MNNSPSPLEYLASFAITFAAGMIATVALKSYSDWVGRRKPWEAVQKN